MDEEAQIIAELRTVVTAPKTAGDPTGWRQGNSPEQLVLTLPLQILDPCEARAHMAFRAVANHADQNVSAILVATLYGRDYHIWRFDWRPPHPHINTRAPSTLRGSEVWTGIHPFEENVRLGLLDMQAGNLPVCVPFTPEPHDFDAFVRTVCDILRIALTEQVLDPPWTRSLFSATTPKR